MPPKNRRTSKPTAAVELDPNEARAAYESLRPALEALRDEDLSSVRVDIHWQQQARAASKGQGLVAEHVAKRADETKRRMLKLASHFFDEHPTFGPELIAIRAGTGYQDTANDLQQLADLYEVPEILAAVSRDAVFHRVSDVVDAGRDAPEIFKALGFEDTEATEWTERTRRAYSLLEMTYAEHCHAGALFVPQAGGRGRDVSGVASNGGARAAVARGWGRACASPRCARAAGAGGLIDRHGSAGDRWRGSQHAASRPGLE